MYLLCPIGVGVIYEALLNLCSPKTIFRDVLSDDHVGQTYDLAISLSGRKRLNSIIKFKSCASSLRLLSIAKQYQIRSWNYTKGLINSAKRLVSGLCRLPFPTTSIKLKNQSATSVIRQSAHRHNLIARMVQQCRLYLQ